MAGTSTKVNEVYQILKKRIQYCEIAPGEPISERSLIEELNIGRTPIREALLRLKNDGFIKIFPQRGIFVSEISLTDVIENYQILEIVETAIFSMTCKQVDKEKLKYFRTLFTSVLENKRSLSTLEYMENDWEFHYCLVEKIQNQRLLEILKQVYERNTRFRVTGYRKRLVHDMIAEHMEILEFTENGECEKACAALRDHIANSRIAVLNSNSIAN